MNEINLAMVSAYLYMYSLQVEECVLDRWGVKILFHAISHLHSPDILKPADFFVVCFVCWRTPEAPENNVAASYESLRSDGAKWRMNLYVICMHDETIKKTALGAIRTVE